MSLPLRPNRNFNNLTPLVSYAIVPSISMPKGIKSSLPSATRLSKGRRVSKVWKPEEDQLLSRAKKEGLKWEEAVERYFPNSGKTAEACRKRYSRLLHWEKMESWDSLNLETLAKHYVAMRHQVWQPLADQLNESWELIEEKCMENGHKKLGSIAHLGYHGHRDDESNNDSDDLGESRPEYSLYVSQPAIKSRDEPLLGHAYPESTRLSAGLPPQRQIRSDRDQLRFNNVHTKYPTPPPHPTATFYQPTRTTPPLNQNSMPTPPTSRSSLTLGELLTSNGPTSSRGRSSIDSS